MGLREFEFGDYLPPVQEKTRQAGGPYRVKKTFSLPNRNPLMEPDTDPKKMNVQLPPSEWLKVLAAVVFGCIPPVAAGAWFLSSMQASVAVNQQAIREVGESVDAIGTQIKNLVRHDERINSLERRIGVIEHRLND